MICIPFGKIILCYVGQCLAGYTLCIFAGARVSLRISSRSPLTEAKKAIVKDASMSLANDGPR